mgnify:CR=1 FL=1
MTLRFFVGIILSVFLCACNAEVKHSNIEREFDASAQLFFDAVQNGDVSKFKAAADPAGVHLVRKFTSGNLGGRGEELSAKVSASAITGDMMFLLKNQTPFNLKIIFPGRAIKDDKALPHYDMPENICGLAFDQWDAPLKEVIELLPESNSGDPIVLAAASECWAYAETQVIGSMLVGGVAVFKKGGKGVDLVSIIDLL